MKKIFILTAIVISIMIGTFVFAGPRMISGPYAFSNVTTNGTVSATNGGFTEGWLDAIKIDIGGTNAAPTGTLVIATVGNTTSNGMGESIVLYSNAITADKLVFPRVLTEDQTGTVRSTNVIGSRIPIAQDRIKVSWTDMNVTNVNAQVYIFLK